MRETDALMPLISIPNIRPVDNFAVGQGGVVFEQIFYSSLGDRP